ncbi:MAG: ABC transporter ATP-binding protein [Leucobacter sp.]|nr:ABC transporter ATP-binding protein [Leucobacter sp.]
MTEPVLALRGISKRFGEVVVADDLDLTVAPGEAVGIVGPNGAGKSTLFSMIAGEQKPDAGTISMDGREINSLMAQERTKLGIGRTFQIPRPFEGMSVFENLLVFATSGAGLHGNAAYVRAAETGERVGLGDVLNTQAGSLGLLARKRLELARGLASDPTVLLLDEVAGGLTEPEVAELVELIRGVQAEGLAIVWIEHVVHALTQTVSRLACLAGGRMIADGDPFEVLDDPMVREVYLGTTLTTEEDTA